MKYTVYQITHKESNKIYIGKYQTKDLNDGYMGAGTLVRRAQNKHGLENFVKEILYVFDTEEEMDAKEAELITEEFCLREDTYNICVGGQGGVSFINRIGLNLYGKNGQSGYGLENLEVGRDTRRKKVSESEEYRSWLSTRISESLKGRIGSFTGKMHTEETKQKIGLANSISQRGNKNSQYGSFWITDGEKSKKIKSVDIIPEGWYKGRKIK